MIKLRTPLLLALILSACATGPALSQYQLDKIRAPVICKDKSDCDSKWSKAQVWIVNNSKWKIKLATDSIIQTEGPFKTLDLAYSATKIINSDGSGEIQIKAGCGNIFGCSPNVNDAILAFKQQF